jgi:Putative prokaryotic signal transducing protein
LTGRLVPVAGYATRGEAEIVQGLLASAGIDSSLSADDAGGAYPFVLSGGAQLLVDEDDVEAASELIASGSSES